MNMHQQALENEYLTPHEVAAIIKKSYRTVMRLIEEGRIEYYKPTDRGYLISWNDLKSYLEGTKNS